MRRRTDLAGAWSPVLVPFLRASSLALATKILAAAIAFAVAPALLRSLGTAVFALWALAFSLSAFASLLEFGASATTTVAVAQSIESEDWAAVRRSLRRGMTVVATATALLLVLFGLAHPLVLRLLSVPAEYRDGATLLFFATVLGWGAQRATAIMATVPDVQRRFFVSQVIPLIAQALVPALALGVAAAGWGLPGLAVIFAGVPLVAGGVVATTTLTELRVRGTPPAPRTTVEYSSAVSAPIQVATIADVINYNLDRVLVASLVSLGAVATYELGLRLASIVLVILVTPQAMLFPVLAATASADVRRSKVNAFSHLLTAAAGLLSAGVFVTAEPLAALWLGAAAPEVVLIARALCVAFALHALTGPFTAEMKAAQAYRPAATFAVVAAAVNTTLTVVMAPIFGLMGVVVATVLGLGVVSLGFLVAVGRLGYGYGPLKDTVRAGVGATMACAVALSFPAPKDDVLWLVERGAVAAVAYAAFALATDRRLRKIFWHG